MSEQDFGRFLRQVRETKGWSQGELAERLGVKPQYVSSLERGKSTPSLDILRKLTVYLAGSAPETDQEWGQGGLAITDWNTALRIVFGFMGIELDLPLPVSTEKELTDQSSSAEVWVMSDVIGEAEQPVYAASTVKAMEQGVTFSFFGPEGNVRFDPELAVMALRHAGASDDLLRDRLRVYALPELAFPVRFRIANPLGRDIEGRYALGDREVHELYFYPAPEALVSSTVDRLRRLLVRLGDDRTRLGSLQRFEDERIGWIKRIFPGHLSEGGKSD